MKFNLTINISQIENAFLVNLNSLGALKQYTAPDLVGAIKIVSNFIDAIDTKNTQPLPRSIQTNEVKPNAPA